MRTESSSSLLALALRPLARLDAAKPADEMDDGSDDDMNPDARPGTAPRSPSADLESAPDALRQLVMQERAAHVRRAVHRTEPSREKLPTRHARLRASRRRMRP